MGKFPYNTLTDDIKSFIEAEIATDSKTGTYFLSRSYTVATMGDYPISVLIRYIGDDPNEALSQLPDSRTRDLNFLLFFIGTAEDDEALDVLINDALSDFGYYLSWERQGGPICGNSLIEWLKVGSTRKAPGEGSGIFASMVLDVRIMEV